EGLERASGGEAVERQRALTVTFGLWSVFKCLCSMNFANSIQSSGNSIWPVCTNARLINVNQE
ncbi:hypothetical protein KUDE01_014583, partial [Dissostichus eleginoides]